MDMGKVSKMIQKEDTVLIDSITSLVTNYMFQGKDFFKEVSEEILSGILEIINAAGDIVIVSDYLFGDSIQYDCYTESFRKEIGIINRKLAEISDIVVECSYGNIIYHKDRARLWGHFWINRKFGLTPEAHPHIVRRKNEEIF